jgi:hypothetical protein
LKKEEEEEEKPKVVNNKPASPHLGQHTNSFSNSVRSGSSTDSWCWPVKTWRVTALDVLLDLELIFWVSAPVHEKSVAASAIAIGSEEKGRAAYVIERPNRDQRT